jgi:undecaprenyl-diphosphatase
VIKPPPHLQLQAIVTGFDIAAAKWINGFVGLYPHFEAGLWVLQQSDLLKGGVLCAVFWFLWPKSDRDRSQAGARLVALTFACFVSLMTARALSVLLPFSLRPIHDAGLALALPHGASRGALEGWSSMPSDHAALFFAFAGGLCFVSRRWGLFALAYTAVMICLPRFVLGLHYPSDLLLGGAGGLACAWVCNRPLVIERCAEPAYALRREHPGAVHAVLFLVTYQIADMFEHTLKLAKAGAWVLQYGARALP